VNKRWHWTEFKT